MSDKIDANVKGTGTRSVALDGHASLLSGNKVVCRAVALELAISSFPNIFAETDEIIARAGKFESFLNAK